MTVARKSQPARAALTKDSVLRTAIGLADAEGIDALTMRSLAQELGVEAMSLYHYVRSKNELLAEMADLALGEIALPPADADWKSALRETSLSARDVLRRHRWVSGMLMTAARSAQLRRMEAVLATLERAGFSPELTDQAYHALESHIVGFTLWLASMPFKKKGDLTRTASDFLKLIPVDRYPHVVKHAEQHMAPPSAARKSEFEFGLDLILDGLERLRATDQRNGRSAGRPASSPRA